MDLYPSIHQRQSTEASGKKSRVCSFCWQESAMGRIYLIRHPACNAREDLPAEQWLLSEAGEKQLESLIRSRFWAGVLHVYASTEPKAEAVAQRVFARHAISFSLHDDLRELRRPPVFIRDRNEILGLVGRVFASPQEHAPGFEPLAAAAERVWRFLTQVVAENALPAAVVSHGIVLSALRARLLCKEKVDLKDWQRLPFAAVAEVESDGWVLHRDFLAPETAD